MRAQPNHTDSLRISPAIPESQRQRANVRPVLGTVLLWCMGLVLGVGCLWAMAQGLHVATTGTAHTTESIEAHAHSSGSLAHAASAFDALWAQVGQAAHIDIQTSKPKDDASQKQNTSVGQESNEQPEDENSSDSQVSDDADVLTEAEQPEYSPQEQEYVEWNDSNAPEGLYEEHTYEQIVSQPIDYTQSNASVPTQQHYQDSGAVAADTQENASIYVTVLVSSDKADGSVQTNTTVSVPQGATAYDVLVATGLPVTARSTQYGVYVAAIGGLAEKQYGGASGWLYAVNGSTPGYSAGAYQLNQGDTVEWFYTV